MFGYWKCTVHSMCCSPASCLLAGRPCSDTVNLQLLWTVRRQQTTTWVDTPLLTWTSPVKMLSYTGKTRSYIDFSHAYSNSTKCSWERAIFCIFSPRVKHFKNILRLSNNHSQQNTVCLEHTFIQLFCWWMWRWNCWLHNLNQPTNWQSFGFVMIKGRNLKICRSAPTSAQLIYSDAKNTKTFFKKQKQKDNKDKASLHWEDNQVALECEAARRKVII